MKFLALLCVIIPSDRRKCKGMGMIIPISTMKHTGAFHTQVESLLHKALGELSYIVNRKCFVNITYKLINIIS